MKKYSIEKYNIVVHQHPKYSGVEIIAWSTYAGKPVYGKAICRVTDNYNEEVGKRLAVARCAAKIARKRAKRADKLSLEATQACIVAKRRKDQMTHYYEDAIRALHEADEEVAKILSELA